MIEKKQPEMEMHQEIMKQDDQQNHPKSNISVADLDKKIKQLLDLMNSNNQDVILPSISFDESKVTYPLLDEVMSGQDQKLLEEHISSRKDMFEKEIHENLLTCPTHPEFFTVSLRLYCSTCSSLDILKLELLEHKICGHITEKSKFNDPTDETICKCPSCSKAVRNMQKEMRQIGNWYQCNACHLKFDAPKMKMHCQKFDHDFEISKAVNVYVPCYKIRKGAQQLNSQIYAILPHAKKLIISKGYIIEGTSEIMGKSSVMHSADIIANKDGHTMIVDIRESTGELADKEIDSLLGKVLDVSPKHAIFIAIPSVSERAKKMTAAHKIRIVSGNNLADIIASLDEALQQVSS